MIYFWCTLCIAHRAHLLMSLLLPRQTTSVQLANCFTNVAIKSSFRARELLAAVCVSGTAVLTKVNSTLSVII